MLSTECVGLNCGSRGQSTLGAVPLVPKMFFFRTKQTFVCVTMTQNTVRRSVPDTSAEQTSADNAWVRRWASFWDQHFYSPLSKHHSNGTAPNRFRSRLAETWLVWQSGSRPDRTPPGPHRAECYTLNPASRSSLRRCSSISRLTRACSCSRAGFACHRHPSTESSCEPMKPPRTPPHQKRRAA